MNKLIQVTGSRLQVLAAAFLSPKTYHLEPSFTGGKI
jgi:hypothetical protein